MWSQYYNVLVPHAVLKDWVWPGKKVKLELIMVKRLTLHAIPAWSFFYKMIQSAKYKWC